MNPEDEYDEVVETVDDRDYGTLQEAFQQHRRSFANQQFLAPIAEKFDAAGYSGRSAYIKVSRRDGGPALEIHAGYTNGFASEDEIVRIFGDVERWHSGRGTGLWGVTHPDHGSPRNGTGRSTKDKRYGGECPTCGAVLPLSGTCDFCG
ncbi:hypothetical protein ASF30_10645 [Leifsonia sp. Leaf264]|nr:hypothetical protein ASF30_10645 [Leifsonia sp. Leaf264]